MQNKTEKQGFIQKIKTLPYSIMNRYVNKHDNTEKFQTMYSGPWFVAFLVMGVITLICCWVDYSVLYGIEYTSSLNKTYSFLSAFGSAIIIQFLIIVGGGLFFKIIIFGKLRTDAGEDQSFVESINKNHVLQAFIFGTLFVYGFTWTIELSNKTYYSAKANAIGNQYDLEEKYKASAALLSNERQNKINELERAANKSIQSKEVHYNSLIASNTAKFEALKAKKRADAKRYNYTKAKLERSLAKYDSQAETKKAALLIEKESVIAPIQSALIASTDDLRSTYTTYEKSLDYKASNDRSELDAGIEATAKETQGRNVTYNFMNVVLMIGLLLFAKSSLDDDTAPTGSDDETQTDEHKPMNTGSSPENDTAHRTDTQEAKTGKAQPKKNKKSSVLTEEHSKTQHKVGEYLEFEDTTKNTVEKTEYFDRDGYEFKKENGTVFIKHGEKGKYVTLQNLNTWFRTYNNRVDQYTREHKHDIARRNATKAAIISQKINYMKQNFVYDKATTENKQTGFMRSA